MILIKFTSFGERLRHKILIFVFFCLLIVALLMFFSPIVSAMLAVLCFLLFVQSTMLAKRIQKHKNAPSSLQENNTTVDRGKKEEQLRKLIAKQKQSLPNPTKFVENNNIKKTKPQQANTKETPVGNVASPKGTLPKIDPAVFERMRAKMQEAQDQAMEEEEVQVHISSANRNKSKQKPAVKSNTVKQQYGFQNAKGNPGNEQAEIGNKERANLAPAKRKQEANEKASDLEAISALFDDIALQEEGYNNPKAIDPTTKKKAKKGGYPNKAPTPLVAEEVWEADKLIKQESVALHTLSLARDYYDQKLYQEAYTALQSFHPETKTNVDTVIQDLLYLQVNVAKELSNYKLLRETYSALLKYYPLATPELQRKELETIVDTFASRKAFSEGISFFLTRLAIAREDKDYHAMNRLYELIEKGYAQRKDGTRLLQTYQSHLSVIKANKDIKKEIELYDILGKLLFETGDQTGSRECYEHSIALQKQLETEQNTHSVKI